MIRNPESEPNAYQITAPIPRSDEEVVVRTIGSQTEDLVGYITDIVPPLREAQKVVVRQLGGTCINSLVPGHSIVLFSREHSRNLFPIPEDVDLDTLAARHISQAFVDIFFSEANDGIPT